MAPQVVRGTKRFRPNKYLLLAVAAAVILSVAGWAWLRPRVISVWVVTDYTFRERPHWDAVIAARFRAVNRIFSGVGIEWRVVNAEHLDPIAGVDRIDQHRAELERRVTPPADLVLSLTGQSEGARMGSVTPFAHAIVAVDSPRESEEQNVRNLAHELAVLFGAPVEPAGAATIMAVHPQSFSFAPRTAALLRRLRNYNFAAGVDALKDQWQRTVVEALADAYTAPSPKPLAHAHLTVAVALDADHHASDAVAQAREAVKADPQSLEARRALAHTLMDDTQPQAALRELREAVRLFPTDAPLHATLGTLLGQQADTDGALQELRTAETLDPRNASYPVAVGSLMVSQTGQIDEAVAEFQKANRLDPAQPAAQHWLRRMDELSARARADLEADLRKERAAPGDANAHYAVGIDEARLGHRPNARQEFQKAADLDPHNGRVLSDLAAMDMYANDYVSARRHVNAARAASYEPPAPLVAALERKERATKPDAETQSRGGK